MPSTNDIQRAQSLLASYRMCLSDLDKAYVMCCPWAFEHAAMDECGLDPADTISDARAEVKQRIAALEVWLSSYDREAA